MRIVRHLTIVCVSVLFLAAGAGCGDDETTEPIVPGNFQFGAQCTLNTDCATGFCLVNDRYPNGFCTQRCAVGVPGTCNVLGECFDLAGSIGPVCLGPCASDTDCNDLGFNLTCQPFGGTQFCSDVLFFQ